MFGLLFFVVPLLAVGARASMPSEYYQAYVPMDYMEETMMDLPRAAEQRDVEHLPQNSLWGHKYMQGKAKNF